MGDLGIFYLERKAHLQNIKKKHKSKTFDRMCNILEDEASEQINSIIETPWRNINEKKEKESDSKSDNWYS